MKPSLTARLRRTQIIDSTKRLFEERGIEHTSVRDIAKRANISRSLFYHYFSCKEDVTDAILDDYVTGFVTAIQDWNATRTPGDVRGALNDCVRLLRSQLFETDAFRTDLLKGKNALLYQQFVQRCAESLARYLTDTTAKDYARRHAVEIKHVYEEFYLLITGLIGYVRHNPNASDELIADLIADTLHLDLEPGNKAV
ncbi:MAG: TetR/AcrR family transcriptional regulator [Olsenella sp.]|nr:TetR/AcrR family transcriptional regulator [Olsenella sp.]